MASFGDGAIQYLEVMGSELTNFWTEAMGRLCARSRP